jgi:hypothetical protein
MAPGREAADVAHSAVEREDHPVVIRGSLHDDRILAPTELLIQHGVHIVTPSSELVGEIVRQVLVELEPHAGNGKISSRASAAP